MLCNVWCVIVIVFCIFKSQRVKGLPCFRWNEPQPSADQLSCNELSVTVLARVTLKHLPQNRSKYEQNKSTSRLARCWPISLFAVTCNGFEATNCFSKSDSTKIVPERKANTATNHHRHLHILSSSLPRLQLYDLSKRAPAFKGSARSH